MCLVASLDDCSMTLNRSTWKSTLDQPALIQRQFCPAFKNPNYVHHFMLPPASPIHFSSLQLMTFFFLLISNHRMPSSIFFLFFPFFHYSYPSNWNLQLRSTSHRQSSWKSMRTNPSTLYDLFFHHPPRCCDYPSSVIHQQRPNPAMKTSLWP